MYVLGGMTFSGHVFTWYNGISVLLIVGRSYRVNCMGGANDCQVSSLLKEAAVAALALTTSS